MSGLVFTYHYSYIWDFFAVQKPVAATVLLVPFIYGYPNPFSLIHVHRTRSPTLHTCHSTVSMQIYTQLLLPTILRAIYVLQKAKPILWIYIQLPFIVYIVRTVSFECNFHIWTISCIWHMCWNEMLQKEVRTIIMYISCLLLPFTTKYYYIIKIKENNLPNQRWHLAKFP